MQNTGQQLWFEEWFNSPYYHLLYKDRDYKEAEFFIDKLITHLNPKAYSSILDLACGKGRHSIYLNKKGFDVTGLDLAANSIAAAQQYENEKLHFYVHDMRHLFRTNYYDLIFNLFTSFGYFYCERDNLNTIGAISKGLKPNGKLVIDFFNAKKVIAHLKKEETKEIDNVVFKISKRVEKGCIIKDIHFNDKGKSYSFTEKVQALTIVDFEKYFTANNLKIVNLLGNYELDAFDENTSDRLIIIAQKTV
jgi:SAM-dependent methyltransferase